MTPMWMVKVDKISDLSQIIDIAGKMYTDCSMRVVGSSQNDGFQGLFFQAIDQGLACLMVARLQCQTMLDVECTGARQKSQIHLKNFQIVLNAAGVQSQLQMAQFATGDKIVMEMIDQASRITCELSTLVYKPPQQLSVFDLPFDIHMDMHVGVLKNIIKTAEQSKAESLQFTLLVDSSVSGPNRPTFIEITIQSEFMKLSHIFDSGNSSASNNQQMDHTSEQRGQGASTPPQLTRKFDINFNVKLLSAIFCAKMHDRQMVSLKMRPDTPMIIEYPLGDNKSYIKWALCPMNPNAVQN